MIDIWKLKAELAGRGLRLLDLARLIERPVTTLSSWLSGRHPGPADLTAQIEKALKLAPGSLSFGPDSRDRNRSRAVANSRQAASSNT